MMQIGLRPIVLLGLLAACSAQTQTQSRGSDDTAGRTTAMPCLHPTLFAAGTAYRLRFRTVRPGQPLERKRSTVADTTVQETTDEDGQPRIVIRATIDRGPDNPPLQQERVTSLDAEAGIMRLHRETTTIEASGDSPERRLVRRYTPARIFDFDLKPGERHDQAYERRTTRYTGDTVVSDVTEAIRRRTTFAGIERVSGPAGLTRACRFNQQRWVDGEASRDSHWLAVDSGMTLRERQFGGGSITTTTFLISAEIKAARRVR